MKWIRDYALQIVSGALIISVFIIVGIFSLTGGINDFRENQRVIHELRQENYDLKVELSRAEFRRLELNDMRALEESLGAVEYDDSFTKVTAKVVAASSADIFDVFTINAGSDHGVAKEDMVVNADGLVGVVTETGRNWSKITGIADSSVSVSFCLRRDPSVIGICSGDGTGSLKGYMFDEDSFILEGDVLVTSGLGYYPAGMEIATVKTVDINKNTQVKEISAVPSADFDSVRLVTVLT